jgi:hypothetical protein
MTKMYESGLYEIRIQGHLENRWANGFEGLTIRLPENGETLITGWVDQTTLYSALRKVRDLGMPLLSVMHVKTEQADEPDDKR